MQQPSDQKREFASLVVLIAANLVPVAGVVLWDWQVRDLIFLYWIETIVLGAFFILRILCASPDPRAREAESAEAAPEPGGPRVVTVGKEALAVFFLVLFGAIWYGLGMLLVAFFHPENQPEVEVWTLVAGLLRERGAYPAVLAMIASHAVSFCLNDPFGKRDYPDDEKFANLMQPFRRIGATQVLIFIGGLSLLAIDSQVVAMVAFAAVKIGLDVYWHRQEW